VSGVFPIAGAEEAIQSYHWWGVSLLLATSRLWQSNILHCWAGIWLCFFYL